LDGPAARAVLVLWWGRDWASSRRQPGGAGPAAGDPRLVRAAL